MVEISEAINEQLRLLSLNSTTHFATYIKVYCVFEARKRHLKVRVTPTNKTYWQLRNVNDLTKVSVSRERCYQPRCHTIVSMRIGWAMGDERRGTLVQNSARQLHHATHSAASVPWSIDSLTLKNRVATSRLSVCTVLCTAPSHAWLCIYCNRRSAHEKWGTGKPYIHGLNVP